MLKALNLALGLTALATSSGCINMSVPDKTQRPPTLTVDVFADGRMPARSFKEIAEMSVAGDREGEKGAQKKFIKQAKDLGGNGLIFTVESTKAQKESFIFKGRVIVYE